MLKEMRAEAQQVPLKILIPIIQNASLEEDDDLQNRWAALLANNASGDYVETAFPEILRQLSSADAHLLRMCFHEVLHFMEASEAAPWSGSIDQSISKWKATLVEPLSPASPVSDLSEENLTRLGLMERNDTTVNFTSQHDRLSQVGYTFARACEDPSEMREIFAILSSGEKPVFNDFP